MRSRLSTVTLTVTRLVVTVVAIYLADFVNCKGYPSGSSYNQPPTGSRGFNGNAQIMSKPPDFQGSVVNLHGRSSLASPPVNQHRVHRHTVIDHSVRQLHSNRAKRTTSTIRPGNFWDQFGKSGEILTTPRTTTTTAIVRGRDIVDQRSKLVVSPERATPRAMSISSGVMEIDRSPSVQGKRTYRHDQAPPGDGQVPVSIFFELKNVTNPVDFLNRYVVEASTTKDIVLIDGHRAVKPGRNHSFVSSIMRERTLSAPFAHAAGCTPQPTTMPIQMDAEPYVMYFPSCTRIERCDGCCNTELLECQPTKTEMTRLQVLRVKYLGPNVNKFDITEPVVVELERHLQCDCLCRVKASDCRFYQIYRPNECRCECANQAEAADCMGERFWDMGTCQCRCRHHHDCSTGFFFNDQTCLCEIMKTGRTGAIKPAFRSF